MEVKIVKVAGVKIPANRPKPSPQRVTELQESIARVGLLEPIGVTADMHLVYGLNRLQAFRDSGDTEIPAVILPLNGLQAQLAEIDENLIRRSLSKMEEAREVARRKRIYSALFPKSTKGKAQAAGANKKQGRDVSEKTSPTFTEDTAKKTGKSRRAVEMDVSLGEQLQEVPEDLRKKIADTPLANNKAQLKRLCTLEEPAQREVVEVVKAGKAKTVSAALGVLEAPEESEAPEDELEPWRRRSIKQDAKKRQKKLRQRFKASLTTFVNRAVREEKTDLGTAATVLREVAKELKNP